MKKRATLFVLLLMVIPVCTLFANGLSLNSIGPKSLGMGGAFIGLADDYTAAYWNPAGVTQLTHPEIGLFVTDVIPSATYKYDIPNSPIDAKTKANHYISPNFGGYFPLMNGDLVVGLGVYVPAGLGAEWDGEQLKALTGGKAYQWKSKIFAYNFSPVVAYKINDMLSVGASFNVYYASMEMLRFFGGQYEENSSGIGMGFGAGLLVKPIDMLSIGVSFKTKNVVKFKGTAKNPSFAAFNAETTDMSRELGWPMWVGGGIGIKPIEGLTITADVQWSNWSNTEGNIITTYDNAVWAANIPEDSRTLHMKWEDKMQIRFGVQYELTKDLAIRAGYYQDPAPAPDSTLNIIFPNISFNAATIGLSYNLGIVSLDFGAEYMIGCERTIEANKYALAMPGVHNMNIIAVSLGASYKFK
ncbi:MAG: outer membrane protein transport protein [Bacteroidota bacterium]